MKRIILTTILILAVALPLVISSSLRADAAIVNFEQYITDVYVSDDKQYIIVEVPLTECQIGVIKQGSSGYYDFVNGKSWFEYFNPGEAVTFNFVVFPMGYEGGFFSENIPDCTINIDFDVYYDDARLIASAQSSMFAYDIDSNLIRTDYSELLSLTQGPGSYSISLPYKSSSSYYFVSPRLQIIDTTNWNVSPYIIEFQLNSLTFEFVTEDFINVDDNSVTNGLLSNILASNQEVVDALLDSPYADRVQELIDKNQGLIDKTEDLNKKEEELWGSISLPNSIPNDADNVIVWNSLGFLWNSWNTGCIVAVGALALLSYVIFGKV